MFKYLLKIELIMRKKKNETMTPYFEVESFTLMWNDILM